MKPIALFLLFLTQVPLYGQRDLNPGFGEGAPCINVTNEYFSRLDSAFAARHKIEEIILYESLTIQGTFIHEKPIVIYRYDPTGKRIHVEIHTWSEFSGIGTTIDYYADSTITVQRQEYSFPDSRKMDSRYVTRYYPINDSLSRNIRSHYVFDSLISTDDSGIIVALAGTRRWQQQQANEPILVYPFPPDDPASKPEEEHICTLPLEVDEYRDPLPSIERDSLGRIVEITSHNYLGFGNEGKVYLVPYKSIRLSWYGEKDILQSCIAYGHFEDKKYTSIVEKAGPDQDSLDFPLCFEPECVFYEFVAEDFRYGVPLKMRISEGEDGYAVRTYRTVIKER